MGGRGDQVAAIQDTIKIVVIFEAERLDACRVI